MSNEDVPKLSVIEWRSAFILYGVSSLTAGGAAATAYLNESLLMAGVAVMAFLTLHLFEKALTNDMEREKEGGN